MRKTAMRKRHFNKRIFTARLRQFVREGGTEKLRSLNQLAIVCGLSDPRRVTDWLSDGSGMPNAENLFRLGEGLGVSVDWLLGFEVPMMRGSTLEPNDLETEIAIHVEHHIAVKIRGKPYAFHMATQVIDGSELLREVVRQQLAAIEEAWRQASVYTRSGIKLLAEGAKPFLGGRKPRPAILEHLAFQAAIFEAALESRSKILRSASGLRKKRTSRPLLELAKDVSPLIRKPV